MKVLVTGASGFVGRHVCRRLLADGHEVTGMSRRPDGLPEGVSFRAADISTGEGLADAVDGQDAVIHLVGIIRETRSSSFDAVHISGTENVLAAMLATGPRRLLHMSALGARRGAASGYQDSKGRAEQLVRESGLDWTIMRPSLIFGPGDGFCAGTLRDLVRLPPVIPVVGDGSYPFRPVAIEDVVTAFSTALQLPATHGRSFDLVGPAEYTLRELLLLVRQQLGVRKPLVNIPLPLMHLGTRLFSLLPNPPVTRDELLMLLQGSTSDPEPARSTLGLQGIRLESQLAHILAYAASA